MAIRPIDTQDEYYDDGLPAGSMFKSIALLLIIVSGMVFGYFYSENKHSINEQMVKAGIGPSSAPSPLPFKPVAAYNPDVDSTLKDLQKESGKMVGDGVASAVSAGTDILGAAAESVSETVSDNVTKQVQETTASSTQAVSNTLYKSTVGQVILQLFQQLPPPAKKEVMKDLIKQLTPTRAPSPTPDTDF